MKYKLLSSLLALGAFLAKKNVKTEEVKAPKKVESFSFDAKAEKKLRKKRVKAKIAKSQGLHYWPEFGGVWALNRRNALRKLNNWRLAEGLPPMEDREQPTL